MEKLESGKGTNQIRSLQRPEDTRWGSHYRSLCSLMELFGPTRVVLDDIVIKGSTSSQKGDAIYALRQLLSFDFVIAMHVMREIVKITDILCQALQLKSQEMVNALTLISTTKTLIQKMRDEKCQPLLEDVVSFCESHYSLVPDMNGTYIDIIRSRHKKDNVTEEHHYRVDVFIASVDYQLQKLNSRFNEQVTELLSLSVALDPRNSYKSFDANDICRLATKFYPYDSITQERFYRKQELEHYEVDVLNHKDLKNASSISDLWKGLCETGKSEIYPLIDRLLRLVLTFPVSTATSERAFERVIAKIFSTDKIIDDFNFMKERRS